MSFKSEAAFFAEVPYKIATFTFPAVPKRVPKTCQKKDPLPNASEDRLEHEKTSKTDPKSVPKIVKFWVPFFLAALGANLGLSCALLARMGAHLASFQPHLGPSWDQLGPLLRPPGAHLAPFGGQREPTWAFWCSCCPSSCPILVHLLANLQVHSHMCWSILSMSSLSFEQLVASLNCQTPGGRRCRAGRVVQS